MRKEEYFIGVGDFGNKVAIELSLIYNGLGDELFNEQHGESRNHLHIHSFPFAETAYLNGKDRFIILAGSVHDRHWQEARKTLHESKPYLMSTIGIDHGRGIDPDTFQPFPDEWVVFPDPSLSNPVEVSQLVLQIFFIHTPWNVSSRGSLISYDLADTKRIFGGKVTKVMNITSDKEHYRQNFSKFLTDNKAALSQAQGILLSLCGQDDVLSIPKANELWEEMKHFTMPEEAHQAFTYHILPENGPDFMATLFLALQGHIQRR